MELDLTEAVEAGATELLQAWEGRTGERMRINESARAEVDDLPDGWCLECSGVDTAALRASTLAVRAAAPIIERAVRERLGGICGDPAPTLVLVDDETQSGAGVICELHHGHPSEWHEAPPGPEYGFLPPMRWRNTSISLASLGDFDSPPSIGRTGASETGGEVDG